VVIIGLDGATFDVIKPLVNQNRLPHLSKIMKNGVHGELKSTIHPITPQAWSTFLTGKNAGKHGIFDFTARKRVHMRSSLSMPADAVVIVYLCC